MTPSSGRVRPIFLSETISSGQSLSAVACKLALVRYLQRSAFVQGVGKRWQRMRFEPVKLCPVEFHKWPRSSGAARRFAGDFEKTRTSELTRCVSLSDLTAQNEIIHSADSIFAKKKCGRLAMRCQAKSLFSTFG